MKRIKISGSTKSGKSRKLIELMTEYLTAGKKCLYISLGDYNESDLYGLINSYLPSETNITSIIYNIEYLYEPKYKITIDELISKINNKSGIDAIFIDPINGLTTYDPILVYEYEKLRDLSKSLRIDVFVTFDTGPSVSIEEF